MYALLECLGHISDYSIVFDEVFDTMISGMTDPLLFCIFFLFIVDLWSGLYSIQAIMVVS